MTTPEHMTSTPSAADRCETGERAVHRLKDQARERIVEAKDQVKHRISETRREVTQQTRRLAEDARERIAASVRSGATTGLRGVCESCHDVRDALQTASQTLRERNDTRAAGYVSAAADGLDRASRYLEDRSPDQLASEAGNVVRNHPGVVLGGIFALGLLTGRFLRASAPAASPATGSGAGGSDLGTDFGGETGRAYAGGSSIGGSSYAAGSTGSAMGGSLSGGGALGGRSVGGGTAGGGSTQQHGQSGGTRPSAHGEEGTAL